jgi:pimeloyl-ACP methyl ester carboxylesterase
MKSVTTVETLRTHPFVQQALLDAVKVQKSLNDRHPVKVNPHATQAVPVPDLFTQNLDGVAWRSKPSWYVVAKQDRTVHPELERFVAKRMEATVHEIDSSHVPMLSNPKLVIEVIRAAANAVTDTKRK